MIELNKEYTYAQICKILGWEQKAGNSKKAQLKEIESTSFSKTVNKFIFIMVCNFVFSFQVSQ